MKRPSLTLSLAIFSLSSFLTGCPTPTDVLDTQTPPPAPQPAPQTPAPAPQPPTPPPPAPLTPMLFVANHIGNSVTAYDNPATLNGNLPPSINLAGAQTQLVGPTSVLVDNTGALVVVNAFPRITAYLEAETANGNLAPDRNVQGAAAQLAVPFAKAHDKVQDELYVVNSNPPAIGVFAGASTTALNGNLAPQRRITSAALAAPRGASLSAGDDLYVSNGASTVLVFGGASGLNGTVAPTRIIASPVLAGAAIHDVLVDSRDTLYVVDATNRRIVMFQGASLLNGAAMPDTILTVTGATQLNGIVVDKFGVGYISDGAKNSIYAFDSIATRNGAFAPDRVLTGANTQLSNPQHMFIRE